MTFLQAMRSRASCCASIARIASNAYIYEITCEKHLASTSNTGNYFFFPFFFPKGGLSRAIQVLLAPLIFIVSSLISLGHLLLAAWMFTESKYVFNNRLSRHNHSVSMEIKNNASIVALCADGEEDLIRDVIGSSRACHVLHFASLGFCLQEINVYSFALVSFLTLFMLLKYYTAVSPRSLIYGLCRARDLPRFTLQILFLKDKAVLTTDIHQKWIYALSYLSSSLAIVQHGIFDRLFLSSSVFASVYCEPRPIPWLGPKAQVWDARYAGGSYIEDYIKGSFLSHGYSRTPALFKARDEDIEIITEFNPVFSSLETLLGHISSTRGEPGYDNVIIYSTACEILKELRILAAIKLAAFHLGIVFQPHPRQRYFPFFIRILSLVSMIRQERGPWLSGGNVLHIVNKGSTLVAELEQIKVDYCFIQDIAQ